MKHILCVLTMDTHCKYRNVRNV